MRHAHHAKPKRLVGVAGLTCVIDVSSGIAGQQGGRWGLSSRIVLLSLGLLLLVEGAVFSVVRSSIEQSARQQIAQELQVGERVWRRLLDQNAQKLSQGAALLAADFGFRSAVSSADLDTIRSALDNHGARIGATSTALMDTRLGTSGGWRGAGFGPAGTGIESHGYPAVAQPAGWPDCPG